MKAYFTLFFMAVVAISTFAQKPSEPFSCYHKKKQFGFKGTSSQDNRGDFIDITNYAINLDISDFATKELNGFTQVTFMPKNESVNSIDLDLLVLDVSSVTLFDTTVLSFTHNDTLLKIDFPTTLQKNFSYKIQVFYNGKPIQTPGDWGGFFWNNTYAFNIGVSFTEDIHNFGKAWFPCFDNFTERSTYDFEIKTQGTHKAFCNGLLLNEIANIDGTKTWVWHLNQQIPTYLANVAVANYATVNQKYTKTNGTQIPIQLGARAVDTTALKGSFVNLNNALLSYETRFGPYLFDRVGYAVTSFNAGAMEHATNITYMAGAVNGNTQMETLMAHELSHHWFGNNTTCETAEDMWLNEGWASYAEAIFTESVYGTEAFKDYNRENHDDVLRNVHIYDGEYLPVSGVSSAQTYSSTVYSKGADMAHTLRGILGDDIFFDAMKAFQDEYKFSHINTDDLNTHLSDFSSLNLTSFFNTWIKEKGFHHYEIAEINTVEDAGNFVIQGSVKQKLWEATTFTDFLPVPITFFDADWNRYTETVFVYGECSDFEFSFGFEPIFWALDLEEGIQDATVDKYEIINSTGITDFGFARIILTVDSIVDSALVRATHHFVKPDPMQEKITDLHISQNRYWSISGILPTGFNANATFKYNGTTNTNTGNLDNDFISASENELTILFRPDAKTDWTIVNDFVLNTLGNANDKVGEIIVNNVQKGDYVLGIYDANITQDTETKSECIFTSINNVERLEKLISVFPVPTKNDLNIEYLAPNTGVNALKIYNVIGKEIVFDFKEKAKGKMVIDTKKWSKGTYILSFVAEDSTVLLTKKIIVE